MGASAVVICGALMAATAWAEQLPDEPAPIPDPVPVATVPILKTEQGFEEQGIPATHFDTLWEQRQTALQRGDPVQERAILNEMVSKRTASGWPNLFTYAIVLARQSLDAAASHDDGLAQRRAQAAVGLAPDHPLTHAAYAQVAWSSGLPTTLVLEEYARAL